MSVSSYILSCQVPNIGELLEENVNSILECYPLILLLHSKQRPMPNINKKIKLPPGKLRWLNQTSTKEKSEKARLLGAESVH